MYKTYVRFLKTPFDHYSNDPIKQIFSYFLFVLVYL